MAASNDLEELVKEYCNQRRLVVDSCLGVGTQGAVFAVDPIDDFAGRAVKFHFREEAYQRERDIYVRLREESVEFVCGHEVPQLLHVADLFLAIEMTIVSPPFCLDFGGAYLDRQPDYSPEVWADWHQQKSENFEDNWPATLRIIRSLEQYGIYIADVNPGNVRF